MRGGYSKEVQKEEKGMHIHKTEVINTNRTLCCRRLIPQKSHHYLCLQKWMLDCFELSMERVILLDEFAKALPTLEILTTM